MKMKTYKIKEHELRKNEIYRIATKTLWQKGYNKTTIRDIAKETGMTTAGLYYYFKSKEELLFQILNGHITDMLAGIEKISPTAGSPMDLIKKYIHHHIQIQCNDRYRNKLMLNDDDCLSGEWYTQVKEKQKRYLLYWRRALENYCRQEGLPTDHIAIDAHFIVGMCNWIYRWYDPKGPVRPEALSTKIYETFIFGLSNKGKPY